MDYHDFLRLAPRYLDDEVSLAEREAIEEFILKDRQAQEELESMRREASWIASAYSRRNEDLGQILIKVRRRNPHRKPVLPAGIAILIQLVLIGGLGSLLVFAASKLAPPHTTLARLFGPMTTPDSPDLEVGSDLPFNSDLTTALGGQATIHIGDADRLMVNQSTTFTLQAPLPTARHVVELGRGEIWGRFGDDQHSFCLKFESESLKDIQIRGRDAELNVVAGVNAVRPLLPRGHNEEKNGTPRALIRVIRGSPTFTLAGGADIQGRPGMAYVVTRADAEISSEKDPDAQHYQALRLNGKGMFKHHWAWMEINTFSGARSIATYPVWKQLMSTSEKVKDIAAKVESSLQETHLNELQERWEKRLKLAEEQVDESTLENTDLSAFTSDWFVKKGDVLHIKEEGAPEVLHLVSPLVRSALESWKNKNDDLEGPFADLFVSRSVSDASNVLKGLASKREARLANAFGIESSVASAQLARSKIKDELSVKRSERESAAAKPLLDLERKELMRLESDIEALQGELEGLRKVREEMDLLELKLTPLESNARVAGDALRNAKTQLEAKQAELKGAQTSLSRNAFDQEILDDARKQLTELGKELTRVEEALQASNDSLSRISAAIETTQKDINSKRNRQNAINLELQDIATELQESESQIPFLKKAKVAKASDQRRTWQALSRLPEEARKGSEEEQAYLEAKREYEEASESLTSLEDTITQLQGAQRARTTEASELATALGTLETELANAKADQSSEMGRQKAHKQELETLKENIEKNTGERDRQLRLLRDRDELNSKIESLTGELVPLQKTFDDAESKNRVAQSELKPVNERYQELRESYSKWDEASRSLSSAERKKRQIESVNRQYLNALVAEVDLLDSLANNSLTVLEKQDLLVKELSQRLSFPGADLQERLGKASEALESKRAELDDDALTPAEKSGELLGIVTLYESLLEDMASLEREEAIRAKALKDAHEEYRVALSWMGTVATQLAREIADRQQEEIRAFQLQRWQISGFKQNAESSDSSLRAFLMELSERELPQVLSGYTPEEQSILLRVREHAFANVWNFFAPGVSAGLSRSSEEDANTAKEDSTLSYSSVLKMSKSHQLMTEINLRWKQGLKSAIASEAGTGKEAEAITQSIWAKLERNSTSQQVP